MRYLAENADIVSCDCSTIEDVHVENENLLLKIDCFLYNDGRCPMKHDCLLILHKFSLIDEQANAAIVSSERWTECENYAASKNIHLYLTFGEFLRSPFVEVQSFDFDWGNQCLTIIGYDSKEKSALWCSLKFGFHSISVYWNEETVW